ncbi:MAG: mandelate racemase [Firmicutes bacterium]|nr:mandelate racemase [Bacillota bacterium]
MRITGIETLLVSLPTRRPHRWASKMKAPIGVHVILKTHTDTGLVGYGEAPVTATWGGAHMMYYGETPATVTHVIKSYLFPAVEGQDPRDLELLHARMNKVIKGHPYAKATVDMSLFDLAGKALGVPAYVLLGGCFRRRVPVTHSLGIMETDKTVEEARAAVAEGIKTLKLKCGVDPNHDLEVMREVRKAVGDRVQIRVDANEGWPGVRESIRIIREMEAYGLFLAEQPVAGYEELARVARAVDTPVMADESAWTPQDVLRLASIGGADLISLYVTKPGGLLPARKVGVVAEAVGIACDIGGSIEMGIGNAANLHLAASVPPASLPSVLPVSAPAESAPTAIAGRYYLDDVVKQPFHYEDGCLGIPEGPGLGVEVDEAKLERYRLKPGESGFAQEDSDSRSG